MANKKPKRNAKGQYAASLAGKNAPKTPKFKPTANPAYAAGIAEIRRSNAAGIHLDKREKRARTRGASIARDLKDQ